MALQRHSPNTIKAYKQYAQIFLQAISEYTRLKKIQYQKVKNLSIVWLRTMKISIDRQNANINLKNFNSKKPPDEDKISIW